MQNIFRHRLSRLSTTGSILILAGLAWLLTQGIYPFILTSDGATRINEVIALSQGREIEPSLLAPMQRFVIHWIHQMSGQFALHTFLQILLFYVALLLLIKSLIDDAASGKSLLIVLVLLACPLTLIFPALITDSAVVFACMALLITRIDRLATLRREQPGFLPGIGYWSGLSVIVFVMFAYRSNSLILAPIIVFLFLRIARPLALPAFIVVALVALAVLVFNTTQNRLAPRVENLGLSWEIIDAARKSGDSSIAAPLGICGDIGEAITRYNPKYLNSIFWDDEPPLSAHCITLPDNDLTIKRAYFGLMTSHFRLWLSVKAKAGLFLLGILGPYENIQRGINPVDQLTQSLGGQDDDSARLARQLFYAAGDRTIATRPFIVLLLPLLLAGFVRNGRTKIPDAITITTFISLGYFAGFFINTQAMEFRYFAPTFFLQLALIIALVYRMAIAGGRRIIAKLPFPSS